METTLNILGYQEDGEWVALALEMDIRGYGLTLDAAWSELRELVTAQINFAKEKNAPELIWFRAEDKYWEMYREAQQHEMAAQLASTSLSVSDMRTGGMPVPPACVAEGVNRIHG